MNYLSLFSGIEAASVAWRPLGWQCVGVAEVDPFPCAVLAHHYPDVPNLGDVTQITDEQIAALGPIDVVVGGSPCQDLSVAGKRAGLAGERSGLFHEQLRIFHAARHLCGARFLVWENVPGAFSSHAGRDFAVVVGAMAGCSVPVPDDGWGTEGVVVGEHGLVEWSVLDAQWFGVAQRRRRVFAVLDVGDWAGRPPILLEPDSLRGDSAPSREARKDTSGSTGDGVARCITTGEAKRQDWETCNFVAHSLRAQSQLSHRADQDTLIPAIAHSMRGESFDAGEDGTGRGTPLVPVAVPLQEVGKRTGVSTTDPRAGIGIGVDGDPMFTLQAGAQHGVAIAAPVPIQNATRGKDQNGTGPQALVQQPYTLAIRGRGDSHDLEYRQDGTANALLTPNGGRGGIGVGAVAFGWQNSSSQGLSDSEHITPTLDKSKTPAVQAGMAVRRLTTVECARLQGFPDDYLSQVPWRGKIPPPDGPMYKALGNSMAVPVMRWIGEQIQRAAA